MFDWPWKSDWEKFMKIINNIAYIKYPQGMNVGYLSDLAPKFKEVMKKYPELDRVIIEIYYEDNIKEITGFIKERCFISATSTIKNLESLNWDKLSPIEIINNKIDCQVGALGVCMPYSKLYLYPRIPKTEAQNDWEKYLNIINNIAYIRYPPVIDFSISKRTDPKGQPDPLLFYLVISQIFADVMVEYPELDRVIVEIYENIKDVKGYMHEACTISYTSTIENLKGLNWVNLQFYEVIQNIDCLSNVNGIDRPFSSQYLYPETMGEKTISSVTGYDLDQMDPFAFEDLIKLLLSKMGFEAETTSKTVDGGIDVIAINRAPLIAGKYIIQCKKFAPGNKVGEPVIRDLYGVVNSENANKGILITTSSFSSKAIDFAHGKPIELIDGKRLKSLMEQYGIKVDFVPQPKTNKSIDVSAKEMQKRQEIDDTVAKIWGTSSEEGQKQKEVPKEEVAKEVEKKEDENVVRIKQHKPLNILIVDDELSIRESFLMILNSAGQHVKTAKDAIEGLKILEKEQVDLIFYKYNLQGMDALEALKIIKEKYPDVNVVIETLYVTEVGYNKAFELGAFGYLKLPFAMEDVYKIVEKVIQKKEGDEK
jgi:CheY-like chemotaxis protein/HJR/Mrr/RecB family endonuclease